MYPGTIGQFFAATIRDVGAILAVGRLFPARNLQFRQDLLVFQVDLRQVVRFAISLAHQSASISGQNPFWIVLIHCNKMPQLKFEEKKNTNEDHSFAFISY